MAHNEIQNKDNAPSKSNVLNSDVVTKNTQIASSSNHHFTINKFYIVSFIVLGFILFFVIFYLPQSVVQPKLESDSKVFMAKEMRKPIDESPWHQAQLAKHRKTSQQILANVLEKQSHLENLHIELWAKNEFKSALEIAQKGDLSYRSQEFDTAISLYTETLQALITIENKIPEMYKKYLAIGNNALDNSNSSIAIDNLKIAMYILPDKIEAQEQYDRALVLDKVLSFAKNGKALMHDQKFEAAKDMFTQALSLDKQSPINKELLSEVNTKIKNRNYSKAMSQGYINLNNKKYDLAVKYFTSAKKINSESGDPQNAINQAKNEKTQSKILVYLSQAKNLELQQAWHTANQKYQNALSLDPSLIDARIGKMRTAAKNKLKLEMQAIIENPMRLSNNNVYLEAKSTYIKATKIKSPGSHLKKQISLVKLALKQSTSDIKIQIMSDDLTTITIYQIGNIGHFTNKQLTLKPGEYTIIGSRNGYRDVRKILTIKPGSQNNVISLKCNEKITNG